MADLKPWVGNTPLIRLTTLSERYHTAVWAKLESRNPGGSVKDRTALALLQDALNRGVVGPDTVIIEATSGNTGIALAMACASQHVPLVICMPEGQSLERKQLFWAYGATVVETPQELRTAGAVQRARELEQRIPGGLMLRQHENPANPAVHEQSTGPEIWEQTRHEISTFVAGVGTGGTVTGVGRFLKRENPDIFIAAVEPESSPVLSGGQSGSHKIPGIGAGFVPDNFDRSVVDRVLQVSDEAAWGAARFLPKSEGLLVGLSSGAVYVAAEQLLQEGHKNLGMIFADSGERYLSAGLYQPTDDAWVRQWAPDLF
ncbi:cysteine synthase A [Sulfobacillus harzensis]|uniref:Cysteine synthase n=1 Tax=Sulfobacillus harzensis TaxID=2729629 RepID=A0A7Y0Q2D1_9FIRM|nr:cysteine synthase A [Sulfobacillus harzensis]NMP21796.1 cysteine synthase A [Sulfobacillus harzensis]